MHSATAMPMPAAARRNTRILTSGLGALVSLFALTLLARWGSLGDPDYHVDETFYLLVGDAMHHGAAPYVDIWDRKPPGLFLFYWLLAGISDSVLTFQIAAILFVTATAWLVTRIARRWADPVGALLAGGLYVAWLQPLLGGGGQSPVFYNLFIVGGVALLVDTLDHDDAAGVRWRGLAAALLCGLAVWFKPTAVVEGAFVVLAFTARFWTVTRSPLRSLAFFLLVGVAASLPTFAGMAWFALHGQFAAFWQATVTSIFLKTRADPRVFAITVRYLFFLTLLLLSCTLLGLSRGLSERRDPRFTRLMLAWLVAAVLGFLSVPNFYSHYALPMVPVLAVLAAPYFSQRPLGPVLAAFAIGWALLVGQSFQFDKARLSSARFDRVAAVARTNMPQGTLYVFDGTPWLYHVTKARRLTRFVFPEHLSMATEARAIGVDPVAELKRVLATRPDVIVTTSSFKPDVSRPATTELRRTLTAGYTFVCALPGADFEHRFFFNVYARAARPDRSFCPAGGGNVVPVAQSITNS